MQKNIKDMVYFDNQRASYLTTSSVFIFITHFTMVVHIVINTSQSIKSTKYAKFHKVNRTVMPFSTTLHLGQLKALEAYLKKYIL